MADDILKEAQEAFELAAEREDENRRAYEDDIDFSQLENQWPEQIRRERENEGRPCLTSNMLAPMIRQVVNDARQNKPGITVHPADDQADPGTAQVMNGIIRNIEQSSNAEVAYDTALECAVAGGFGYFRINTAYTTEDTFDQDIVIERISDPLSVYGDPYSKAADSSDWNTAFVVSMLSKKQYEKTYKGAAPVDWNADAWRDLSAPWRDTDNVMTAEYWTREEVKRTVLLLSSGDVVDVETYEANKEIGDALGITVAGQREVASHKVTQRVLSGAEELSKVEWRGKYIPIIPVYGSEVNLKGKRYFRSMIRSAKDAQRMRNYWRTTTTELVSLAPKAPWVGPVGSFETDAAKWATANSQAHAFLEYDNKGEAPQRNPFAGIPAGALQEALNASDDIKAIVGIYDSSLGARSNETSGTAINARDRQADTGTFHFIDNLSRGMRHAGRVILDLIPHVYPIPRVVRIIGADGKPSMAPVNQQFEEPQTDAEGKPVVDPQTGQVAKVSKIYDLTVGKYDLIVKAGPSFASKRDEFVAMASELMRGNPLLQQVLTPMIIENFDIPDADKITAKLDALQQKADSGVSPEDVQAAKDQFAQMEQQLQAVMLENQQIKADKSNEARKLEIQAFDAETKRLQVLKPDPIREPADAD